MKIVSVMPIKLNNERLPGKNTKLLGGQPLIKHGLDTISKVDAIDEKYVYCSNPSIKEFIPIGVEFLQREEWLDTQQALFNDIFESFAKKVPADIYVYTHATSPYLTVESINECIEKVLSGKYDSAFTATAIQDFLWDENNNPLNFKAERVPRSQDLPKIYRETSGCYVFTLDQYKITNRRIGQRPYIKVVGDKEAVDINTPEDFKLAELFYNFK